MTVVEKNGYFLEYQPKYGKYRVLMRKRIVEILLVSSIYDSFIMEEDVRLSDQIYEEFQIPSFNSAQPLLKQYADSHLNYKKSTYHFTKETKDKIYDNWKFMFNAYRYSK